MGLLVLRKGESRGLVAFKIMAAVTSVEVWSCRELSTVTIGVAVHTFFEFDPVESVLSLGDMALRAFQPSVSTLQWILRRGMLLYREFGRLPALNRMAGTALPTIGSLRELPIM